MQSTEKSNVIASWHVLFPQGQAASQPSLLFMQNNSSSWKESEFASGYCSTGQQQQQQQEEHMETPELTVNSSSSLSDR